MNISSAKSYLNDTNISRPPPPKPINRPPGAADHNKKQWLKWYSYGTDETY